MSAEPKPKQSYFKDAIDWDEQRRMSLINRSIRNRRLAWGNGALAAVAIVTIAVLVPLKSFIPVVIRVDSLTGAYDVSVGWRKIDMNDPSLERVMITDLTRYTNAREGFTRGTAETNYAQVYLMSCGQERIKWDQYFRVENNPNSPVKTYGPNDEDVIDIKNISFLPTDREDVKTAQIRFDKTNKRGSAPPLVTRYISTIEFSYSKENAPSEVPQMQYNAFGLCVNRYTRSQEGETRTAPTISAVPAEPQPVQLQPQAPVTTNANQSPAYVAGSGDVTPGNFGIQGGHQQ